MPAPEVIRRLLAIPLLIAAALAAIGTAPGAGAETHVAGLVIDYGDGSITYAVVPFEKESMSGIELLRASGLSLVSIPFGGLGEGICSIESHGCGLDDCRRLCQTGNPNSPFWHYFVLGDAHWEVQNRGASGTDVLPGAIHGWSWTDESPLLPELTFSELAERAGFTVGANESTFRTFDASGSLVSDDPDSAPWLAYAGVALMLLTLVLSMAWMRRRRTRRSIAL